MPRAVVSRDTDSRGVEMRPEVTPDATPLDTIRELMEAPAAKRLFNPLTHPFASRRLRALREHWAGQGMTTAFTSGVYDLMHLNHRAYLLNTKLAAVPRHYEDNYASPSSGWGSLTSHEKRDFSLFSLASQQIKLVVSIDGNEAVAARKGGDPKKGGAPRPVYDWETRARDVLSVAVEAEDEKLIPLADAITIHDNQDRRLAFTPHCGIMEIAEFVAPDVWSIYFESQDIIDALQDPSEQRFADVESRVLEGHDLYSDALLEGPFSTTRIVKRLGGAAVATEGAIG